MNKAMHDMKRICCSLLFVAATVWCGVRADEGMWMITNLSERTDSVLRSMGLELTRDEIFSADRPCLNNAIVQFGGFCSGVVVSPQGLVFTNHHCGYSSIQEHSSTAHNYLDEGFCAKSLGEELPNEGLYVDFHLNTYEVTDLMMGSVRAGMTERERSLAMDSVAQVLQETLRDSVRGIFAEVVPYYKGSRYYLILYQRYPDVRLVCAPPQCLGKHGGDTDNWMWPRQTCDFSVFRVYAGRDNLPAAYSEDNVPYRPLRFATVSTQGYEPGSFCMTFGYPGSTDRYLSSIGIVNTMYTVNDVRIQVRDIILRNLREAMGRSDSLRIMYASKYAQCSNYYKFSIGQNKALKDLGVIAEKYAQEREMVEWARRELAQCRAAGGAAGDELGRCGRLEAYTTVLDSLRDSYDEYFAPNYARELWMESCYRGSDVLRFVLDRLIRVMEEEEDAASVDYAKLVEKTYKDIDLETDKRILKETLDNLFLRLSEVVGDVLPEGLVDSLRMELPARVEKIYQTSIFARPQELARQRDDSFLQDDPFSLLAAHLLRLLYNTYFEEDETERYERLLGEAMREMDKSKESYPDANFTLRMSFGMVEGYNGYQCFTPSQSILDKYERQGDNPDYQLTHPVYEWLKRGKWGKRYVDRRSDDLQLCFLTNNDITGGNSGSGMFDGKGRLIGLAFDGNWEAMSCDLKFDPRLTRCIGVDIRYVLSVIEKYEKGKRLIKELTLE